MTQILFTVLLIAICPLMMFFMMRGMMGGRRGDDGRMQEPALPLLGSSTQDARIAELESEVARLSKVWPAHGSVDSIATEKGQVELDPVATASMR